MAFLGIMATLGLDGKSYAAGMNLAKRQASDLGKHINKELMGGIKSQLLGAFSVAGVIAASKATIDFASRLADTAEALTISTDALQEFNFAASLTGKDEGAVQSFFEKLAASRQSALEGNAEMAASFSKVGVSIDDLKNKRLEDIAKQMGRFLNGKDTQNFAAAMRDVGGKGGASLIPTLSGLDEAAAQLREIGGLMTSEMIQKLDVVGDKFTTMGLRIKVGLAPIIDWFADFFREIELQIATLSAFLGAFSSAPIGEKFKAGRAASEDVMAQAKKQDEALAAMAKARADAEAARGKPEDVVNKEAVKAAEKVLELKQKLLDLTLKNALAGMTAEEKINRLIEERNEIDATQVGADGPLTEEQTLKNQIKREELLGAINDARRGMTAPSQNFDSAARIGGFTQGADNGMKTIAQRQLVQLVEIADNTANADLGPLQGRAF